MAAWITTALVLYGLILVSVWAVFCVLYQILKQQGRMLLRLDEIEQSVGIAGTEADGPRGLSVGARFPPFTLPDLTGAEVSLEGYRGKRVLLVNWSAHCGPCRMAAPQLARAQAGLLRRNVELLLVSTGDAGEHRAMAREFGPHGRVLLAPESQPVEGFKRLGTPVAYLLDEQGQVAQPLAEGVTAVAALAGDLAKDRQRKKLPGERPLRESRIERGGLKAGAEAPRFRLPDVNGRIVSLDGYLGRKVLLVFTDPHCGPCEELARGLARLHRQYGDKDLAVLMVGRGDRQENRQKALQHGIEFPVLVQEKWELSKEYGMFATPVAFLIGQDGAIAQDAAQGANAILALAQNEISGPAQRMTEDTMKEDCSEQAELV